METRIGGVTLVVRERESVKRLNGILSEYGPIIRGRMGIPFGENGIKVISLIVEGSTDEIGAMTGKIGRLEGVEARSVLSKEKF
ncbi:MAG: iron-only hydrogenase system regulator [Spirochaetales bacterium]|nr:iron-only hydrogenase system regulator [Spirochaetales bacterium]